MNSLANSWCFKLHRSYSNSFNLSMKLANFSGVELLRTVSKFTQRKRKWLSCVPVLHKTDVKLGSLTSQSCSDGKKCTKKCDTGAKLLFCQSKPITFFLFSLPSARHRRRYFELPNTKPKRKQPKIGLV